MFWNCGTHAHTQHLHTHSQIHIHTPWWFKLLGLCSYFPWSVIIFLPWSAATPSAQVCSPPGNLPWKTCNKCPLSVWPQDSTHYLPCLPSYTDWLNPPAHPSLPLEGELFRARPNAFSRRRVSTRPKKWEAETTATWLINLSCLNFAEAKSIGSGNFLDKKYRRPEAKL